MLRLKKQPYNSVWISADSQEELAISFMRFQEHYESINPDFKDKIFTVGQLRSWYSKTYGGDTYHRDWIGFNFPSSVLISFKNGLFDPLTNEEKQLLDLFKYRNDHFYIIGAQDEATLRHELAHALYSYSKEYKQEIDFFITKHKSKITRIKKYILDKGYSVDVLNDEIQAYVTDNDDTYILSNVDQKIIIGINNIRKKYEKKYSKTFNFTKKL